MPSLTLWQCGLCGYGTFTVMGYQGPLDAVEIKSNADGSVMQVCGLCVAHLESRRGMYELTGSAAAPTKVRNNWPPSREQNEHPDRSS
jgi:hypothetical protein